MKNSLKKIRYFIYKKLLHPIAFFILSKNIKDKSFTIFSNDCYGGEIYYWLQLPYNTPFVGLMLMIPCYIKFLKNPKYYLDQELLFIENSKYEEINLNRKVKKYPIALLDDIEIHFLHYNSPQEAKQKWERRKKRINWHNIKVKLAMDKDYASEEHLYEFEKLNFMAKVSFSKYAYNFSASNIVIPSYVNDAVVLFRESIKYFDLVKWINTNTPQKRTSFISKLNGYMLYTLLKKVKM